MDRTHKPFKTGIRTKRTLFFLFFLHILHQGGGFLSLIAEGCGCTWTETPQSSVYSDKYKLIAAKSTSVPRGTAP